MKPSWQTWAAVPLLAAAFFFAGKFGLSLAFVHESATAVWPPSGIALAALLLGGYRLWPGIFIGAFLVNATTHVSTATSLGIAAGNTLEALSAAWLARRYANGVEAFGRTQSIFKFIACALIPATVVGAAFGVTSLALGGFAAWNQFPEIWATWWLGDTVGAIVVAPLLIIAFTKASPPPLQSPHLLESVGLLLAVVAVGQIVFLGGGPFADKNAPLGYFSLLPLFWAGFRFGPLGAAVSAFVMSGIALWGTLHGYGPFVTDRPNESLLFLQAFTGTVTVTALVLAAAIAERKRAEQALRHAKDLMAGANEELELRVRDRTVELERAHAALVKDMEQQKRLEEELRQAQKLEGIGTLAAGVAHDFNNILNIVRGYASLLRGDRSEKTVVESLNAIDEGVERGAATVRQLLTLARKSEAQLTFTDVNGALSELARLLRQTFPKTIDIGLELDPDLPPVMADQNQIRQALLNLCVNARDAMPAGGKLILRTSVVDGAAAQNGADGAAAERYARVEVIDSGMGMEESVRERIFEPFFTTKQTAEGTGRGRAIVYGIVKNHRGFIEVQTRRGHGSAFLLHLPVFTEAEPAVGAVLKKGAAGIEPPSGGRGTILLVEDEEHMMRLVRDVLARRGYDVLVARDGEQALDVYRSRWSDIDLVLLDIGLPKIDGWDVMLRIKEKNPAVKIIVASGYIEPELRAAMNRAGVKDFFYKPYALENILERVGQLIEPRAATFSGA